MPLITNFEDIIKQNPQAWREASPEERDSFIQEWAMRRAEQEGKSRYDMDEWVREANGVVNSYLTGAPKPPPPISPVTGWERFGRIVGGPGEYPRALLAMGAQFLKQMQGKPTGKRVYPISHTLDYMFGDKPAVDVGWLPGSPEVQRTVFDPLTYWGLKGPVMGLLKWGGRKLAPKLPTFAKGAEKVKEAGGGLLQGARGRLTSPPTAPTPAGVPPAPPVGGGIAPPGSLYKRPAFAPTAPPPQAPSRIITPRRYMGPRPTPTMATPHGLVQRLRAHFIPTEAKRVVQFVTQNPRDPLSKRVLAGQFDKATLREIQERLLRVKPQAATLKPPPAVPRPVEMPATAAEEVQGMGHGQFADMVEGVQ